MREDYLAVWRRALNGKFEYTLEESTNIAARSGPEIKIAQKAH
jgi:hypothetical protein